MKVSKIPGLGRFGIFIDDVDFNNITEEEWNEIGKMHLNNLVTIIRDTKLDPDTYTGLINRWGKPRSTPSAMLEQKYKMRIDEIIEHALTGSGVIDDRDTEFCRKFMKIMHTDNDNNTTSTLRVSGKKDENGDPTGMFAEGELLWHSNESGNLCFTPEVSLLAHECTVGSSTGFCTTVDWYEEQTETFRSELNEIVLIHKFFPGKINPGLRKDQDLIMNYNMCPVDGTEMPLVCSSPGGHIGLHYSVNTISHVKGMTKSDSQKFLEHINKTLFVDKYLYDHWYQNEGDLCLFDNSITLHRRLGDTTNRVCYRVQYDPIFIVDEPYMPYIQKDFKLQYINQMQEYIKNSGYMNHYELPVLL